MGGDCLNTGCVPSKALIRSAKLLSHIARAKEFGHRRGQRAVRLRRCDGTGRARRPHGRAARLGGTLHADSAWSASKGRPRITSPWTVEVQTAQGPRTLTTPRHRDRHRRATRSCRPFPASSAVRYLTSDTLWELRALPPRLVVLGGGPIGCELAQAFARLGSRVTLVEMAPRLMLREDPDVSQCVLSALPRRGHRRAARPQGTARSKASPATPA